MAPDSGPPNETLTRVQRSELPTRLTHTHSDQTCHQHTHHHHHNQTTTTTTATKTATTTATTTTRRTRTKNNKKKTKNNDKNNEPGCCCSIACNEFTDPFLSLIDRDGTCQHSLHTLLARDPRNPSLRLVTIATHPGPQFESQCSKNNTSIKEGLSPGSRQRHNTTQTNQHKLTHCEQITVGISSKQWLPRKMSHVANGYPRVADGGSPRRLPQSRSSRSRSGQD